MHWTSVRQGLGAIPTEPVGLTKGITPSVGIMQPSTKRSLESGRQAPAESGAFAISDAAKEPVPGNFSPGVLFRTKCGPSFLWRVGDGSPMRQMGDGCDLELRLECELPNCSTGEPL